VRVLAAGVLEPRYEPPVLLHVWAADVLESTLRRGFLDETGETARTCSVIVYRENKQKGPIEQRMNKD
jgi:hypothetical protein